MFLLSFSIQPDATGAPGRQSTTQLAAPVGFCLIAHDYVSKHNELDREQKNAFSFRCSSSSEVRNLLDTSATKDQIDIQTKKRN